MMEYQRVKLLPLWRAAAVIAPFFISVVVQKFDWASSDKCGGGMVQTMSHIGDIVHLASFVMVACKDCTLPTMLRFFSGTAIERRLRGTG